MTVGPNPEASPPLNDTAGTLHLRVSAEKVSRLLDLVGELSLSVSETIQSPDLTGLDLTRFESSAHRLKLVVREVQTVAAELRLVPIGDVFRRMRRLVRELERQTGKEVDLELAGEETEIDKLIVDRLFEPLVHLIRNSVDHGVETPEQRLQAGKPRRGVITLSATQMGGEVQITIVDDGRGLNRERILARARERGFVGPKDEPRDEDLWPAIFLPGFSTADVVTNLSGRGVGMDVLNHTMAELHGHISIRSTAGVGASMQLSIPLTLAFLDCILMRIGGCLYATPIDSVSEIYWPQSPQVTTISAEDGQEVVTIRADHIPIFHLNRFYGAGGEASLGQNLRTIVVFNTSRGRLGLPVDEMLGQSQVIMKPLAGALSKIRGGVGWALLGTGDVALVLDCEKLRSAA